MRTTLIAFIFAACVFGQANTGGIRGVVSDSSGAVVPGAKIVVTNVRTGVQSSSSTDNLGAYLFEFLPPGEYRIEAEVAGFKKFIRVSSGNLNAMMLPRRTARPVGRCHEVKGTDGP